MGHFIKKYTLTERRTVYFEYKKISFFSLSTKDFCPLCPKRYPRERKVNTFRYLFARIIFIRLKRAACYISLQDLEE